MYLHIVLKIFLMIAATKLGPVDIVIVIFVKFKKLWQKRTNRQLN